MKHLKTLIATAVLGAASQMAGAAGLPGPLVTTEWLNAHLNDVVLVDIRDNVKSYSTEPKYVTDKAGKKHLDETGGHIAGAISVDFGKIRTAKDENGVKIKAQLPSAEDFAKAMDAAGLNKTDKPIIIVPTGENVDAMDMAARLYFQLRYFGQAAGSVAILNGGVNAWLQAGLPVSTDAAPTTAGDWTAGKQDAKILASMDQVKADLAKHQAQFIDARPTNQYLGIVTKPVNKAGGHLAGAKSLPTDAIVKHDGAATEFMSAAQYRAIYAAYGIKPHGATVTYCNTGHLASGAWFVNHEILGNHATKLYAGSMIEWTNLGGKTVTLPQ